jgi:lipopolysaccharide export system protein LptA
MMDKKLLGVFLAGCLLAAGPLAVGYAEKNGEQASLDADTVEYDMTTGLVVATDNVLMKRGDAKVAGHKATYNTKTMDGLVEGNVIAVRKDMRVTCDILRSDGQEHMQAIGHVHGTQQDKEFVGEQVDYYPRQNDYVLIENGGTISSKDGKFTADRMEGWLKDEHYIGTGNAHLVSPPKDLEAAGDRVDYFGKTENKVVLTGHAWAVQENNTMRGNVLTVYLAKDGQKPGGDNVEAEVTEPEEAGAEKNETGES